jgi:outer membrane protein insertion porin family
LFLRAPAVLLCLLLAAFAPISSGQTSSLTIAKVLIEHVGPATVSDTFIRAHIRVKPGDQYQPVAVDDDVHSLYATGLFRNVQVTLDTSPQGLVLTYKVQANPRITEIRFEGNQKFTDAKLRRKISSKEGEPFDEQKVFTDSQDIQKMYQKVGYSGTTVKYTYTVDEAAGRATVTFHIHETPREKIVRVDFAGARAFSQRRLRRVIKTRKHWIFSWLTGSGVFKEEQFEDDKERLAQFYYDHGYIDFRIKNVQFLHPTPHKMVIRFLIDEGTQYKVGAIKFTGNQIFSTTQITNGLRHLPRIQTDVTKKPKLGPNGLPMDVGDTFTPQGMRDDIQAVEDFYGARGYIDVTPDEGNLTVSRIPNIETGTMDLQFKINEGQKSRIEKIEIRGNVVTKDKVIRRELAVYPGETFDMVRVKLSRQRLLNLTYFSRVDARSEPTSVPDLKNLVVSVDEKNTGNFTLGAGFSSIDELVGFAEVYQGNFDLFNPPTFRGGGQKFRLDVQLGTVRQDYSVSFIEPWFLGRKLALGVDLYYHDWDFQSPNDMYDEYHVGGRLSLTRALGSEFLIGSVFTTLEDVGITLNSPYSRHAVPPNVPIDVLRETGYTFLPRLGASIAYDTRNSVELPNKGQRTELSAEFADDPSGDREFYKLELKTAWYFRGLAKGHVLELVGDTGIADSFTGSDVPFYDRYYLGGLYTLRGFDYRMVSPRGPLSNGLISNEPIGGDSYWFGSAEYSIPIISRLRFAVFYDIGSVQADPYSYDFSDFSDNAGVGLRLNLPIGPLRLDYGIPIHHDKYSGSSGKFQFGVGWHRPF